MTSELLKKLDVSWLQAEKAQTKTQSAQSFIDEAAETVGDAFLKQAIEMEDDEVRVHDVVEAANLDFKDVINVIDPLVKRHLLEIIEYDKFGNHLVSLTKRGLRYMT